MHFDIGDNRLMKSIIDHRNRRRSAIDNRLSAIIATSLSVWHNTQEIGCSSENLFVDQSNILLNDYADRQPSSRNTHQEYSFHLYSGGTWWPAPQSRHFWGARGENPPASRKWPQVSPNASQSWFKHLTPFHIYSIWGHNTNRRRVELIGHAKMTTHCDLCSNPMRSPLELCTLGSNLDL